MKPLITNNKTYAFVTEHNGISYWRNVDDPKDEVSFGHEIITDKKGKKTKKEKVLKAKIKDEKTKWQ